MTHTINEDFVKRRPNGRTGGCSHIHPEETRVDARGNEMDLLAGFQAKGGRGSLKRLHIPVFHTPKIVYKVHIKIGFQESLHPPVRRRQVDAPIGLDCPTLHSRHATRIRADVAAHCKCRHRCPSRQEADIRANRQIRHPHTRSGIPHAIDLSERTLETVARNLLDSRIIAKDLCLCRCLPQRPPIRRNLGPQKRREIRQIVAVDLIAGDGKDNSVRSLDEKRREINVIFPKIAVRATRRAIGCEASVHFDTIDCRTRRTQYRLRFALRPDKRTLKRICAVHLVQSLRRPDAHGFRK